MPRGPNSRARDCDKARVPNLLIANAESPEPPFKAAVAPDCRQLDPVSRVQQGHTGEDQRGRVLPLGRIQHQGQCGVGKIECAPVGRLQAPKEVLGGLLQERLHQEFARNVVDRRRDREITSIFGLDLVKGCTHTGRTCHVRGESIGGTTAFLDFLHQGVEGPLRAGKEDHGIELGKATRNGSAGSGPSPGNDCNRLGHGGWELTWNWKVNAGVAAGL